MGSLKEPICFDLTAIHTENTWDDFSAHCAEKSYCYRVFLPKLDRSDRGPFFTYFRRRGTCCRFTGTLPGGF